MMKYVALMFVLMVSTVQADDVQLGQPSSEPPATIVPQLVPEPEPVRIAPRPAVRTPLPMRVVPRYMPRPLVRVDVGHGWHGFHFGLVIARPRFVRVYPLARRLAPGEIIPLQDRPVRVKDLHNIAPGSLPTEIVVYDPYTCKDIKLVVCLPRGPIAPQEVSRFGRKVQYDYGKYEVEVHFSPYGITIDYDD